MKTLHNARAIARFRVRERLSLLLTERARLLASLPPSQRTSITSALRIRAGVKQSAGEEPLAGGIDRN
jgi:hypothetical protein